MTFDGQIEYRRAAEHAESLLSAGADELGQDKNRTTLYGMLNYMTGVMETIRCLEINEPIGYDDNLISEVIKEVRSTQAQNTDLKEEEDRARAFFHSVSAEPIPDDPEQRYYHGMTLGILSGIIAALQMAQGGAPLVYDNLIPNTPEGL